MIYDKESVILAVRQNLNVPIVEFAKDILNLPEENGRASLMEITFGDIFGVSSINTQDECLAEMIKPKNILKIQNKDENGIMQGLKIKDIEDILKCDRALILKTLESLEMNGGMNGWEAESNGIRRGKRYWLKKKTS